MDGTGSPGASGVSAFIIPADLPGIKLGKKDRKMRQRGTMTCDVIGGVPGQGFKTAMKVLDRGRLNISAVACGIAQRVLERPRSLPGGLLVTPARPVGAR
jgi:acyl-CoA dehydrogenase